MAVTEVPGWPAGTASRLAPAALAGLSLAAAAVVHGYVTPEHLREWLPAGLFFAVVSGGQAALAVLLVVRLRPVVLLGAIASSAALVILYVWSRTIGPPFMPAHANGQEHTGDGALGHAVGGRGSGVPVFPGDVRADGVEAVGLPDLIVVVAELSAIALLVGVLPSPRRRLASTVLASCGLGLLVLRAVG